MTGMICRYVISIATLTIGTSLFGAPAPPPRKINTCANQMERLDPRSISEAQRRPWHPRELVAIVGDQRGRHWNSFGFISYFQDGKRIATKAGRGYGSKVYIWDETNLHFLAFVPIDDSKFIHFLPHADALLTCGEDGQIRLWDVRGQKFKASKSLRKSLGTCSYFTACSPDGQKFICDVSASGAPGESGYNIIDLTLSPPRVSFLPINGDLTMYSAAFSQDSRLLATFTGKKEEDSRGWGWFLPYNITNLKIIIWNISGQKLKQSCILDGKFGELDSLVFSPDGKTLVVGASLWDLSGSKPKFRASLLGPEKDRNYVFNSDGSRTVSYSAEDFQRHCLVCCFTPDGRYAITNRIKNEKLHICVHDMRQPIPKIIQTITLPEPYCEPMAVSPDGKFLAVGEMNTLHVWPIKDGKIQLPKRSCGHLSDVTALSFGACGNLLATASKDATLRLWDLDGSHPHHRFVLKGDMPPWRSGLNAWDSIALSPDGTKLATASQKRGLTIWSVSPSGLRVLARHKCGISSPPNQQWGVPAPSLISLAFTPDSKTLFLANGTDPIKLIDLANPSAIAAKLESGERAIYRDVANPVPRVGQVALPAESEPIRIRDTLNAYALAVSPDGQTLAVAAPHEIEIWRRTEKGWNRQTGFWHLSHEVHSMAFERSSNTLLVGSRCGNGEVRRFDLRSEKPVQLNDTVVHERPITSVAASSNGKFLAASDEGGRVVVWSAGMEKKLHEWTFPGPVHCVSFAPDGYHLALGNGDGTVYILRLAVPTDN